MHGRGCPPVHRSFVPKGTPFMRGLLHLQSNLFVMKVNYQYFSFLRSVFVHFLFTGVVYY